MSGLRKENLQQVKVYVRPRPLNEDERDHRCKNVIQQMCGQELHIKWGLGEKKYVFDGVFNEKSCQADIYKIVVAPMINFIISGYNCTVFAYGQTGTGKTHTIVGNVGNQCADFKQDPSIGMIPRAAINLFDELVKLNSKVEYTVQLSFIEIYNEEVRDLLTTNNDTPLRIFEDPESKGSVCVKGMREVTVCTPQEVFDCLLTGTLQRQTASTKLNRNSSRSHTVFTLLVHTRETSLQNEELIKTGKLHIVDLAGSENIGRSGASDMRAREAGTINKSLLTLGKVIKALSQKMQHVPYRDSKLTRILQDSLGGKTKTSMIATFTPSAVAWDETLSTLEYAHLARNVANCPQVNERRKEANILNDLKGEMQKLKRELSAARAGEGFFMSQENYDELTDELERKKSEVASSRQRQAELLKQKQELEESANLLKLTQKKIEDSFKKTKNHLKLVREQQKIKDRNARQCKHELDYLTQREAEVTNEAIRLRNICEATTQREAIYHNKYENQCVNTLENAQSAALISTRSSSFCNDLSARLQGFGDNAEIQFNEIQTNNDVVGRVNEKAVEILKDSAMKLKGELTRKRDFSSLVKNDRPNRFNENDILLFFTYLFDEVTEEVENDSEQVCEAHLAVKNDARKFEEDVATTFAEAAKKIDLKIDAEQKLLNETSNFQTDFQRRAKTVLEMVQHQSVFVDNEQFCIENQTKRISDENSLLQDQLSMIQKEKLSIKTMMEMLRERDEALEKQKQQLEIRKLELNRSSEELEKQKIQIAENKLKIIEIQDVVNSLTNWVDAKNQTNLFYLRETPMGDAKQLLDVCQTASVQFSTSSLDHAGDVFNGFRNKWRETIVNVSTRVNKYNSELIDTIKRNVAADSDVIEITLKEVLHSTDAVRANLSSTVTENVVGIDNNVQIAKLQHKNFIADIQNAASTTVNEIENLLKENVHFLGHAGDTPARPEIRIPQRIEERLPRATLLERFIETDHDASIEQSDVDGDETISSPSLSNGSPDPGLSSGSGTHSSSFECINENHIE